jgi:hypothetical protein
MSNECARYLNELLDWKYRFQKPTPAKARSDAAAEGELIFSRVGRGREADPARLYTSMALEFGKVLDKIKSKKYGTRKNEGNNITPRRVITLHSFRRFVKTVIENNSSSNYSEWFLGHAKSSYWVSKPEELRRIYKEDCMKYLTFLDYPTIQAETKSIEARLSARIKELEGIVKQKDKEADIRVKLDATKADDYGNMMEMIKSLQKEVAEMKAAKSESESKTS